MMKNILWFLWFFFYVLELDALSYIVVFKKYDQR